ncbi:hypothetical protein AAP_05195 [Ascosphaera apis ARSEF 7405]|uniref:tRNA N(3)-methylcytidine methyltransferase n=1 Tax=Ascosphaera apis ARSEF 7405 TaxID=392613 RepID=A0A167VXB4_9EURO|nr:hypothetical protein AAP_05195 [Ascosphaera apis ARSEF 7405]
MEPQSLAPDADYKSIARAVQPPQIPACRSHDPNNNQKRTDPFQFGSRYLEEGDNVFEFNAWDHVETDEGYKEYAELQYARQRENPVSDFDRRRFNSDPAKWWNLFYKNNTANFFKNRKWLQQEFPILAEVTQADAGPKVVLEIGAGAGNSAFPILAQNKNPQFKLHACDYSKKAVEVMRSSEHYDEKFMSADVWDVSAQGEGSLPPGLEEGSVDVAVMIFVFSALAPTEWNQALTNVYRVLKPGGVVLFRDYGRGDLAQVRFKKGRYLDDNFYVRGDGTRVYFFEKEQLEHIWGKFSPETGIPPYGDHKEESTENKEEGEKEEEEIKEEKPESEVEVKEEPKNGFEVLNLGVDRRLLVNRQKQLKMYRCWIQGRFKKTTV